MDKTLICEAMYALPDNIVVKRRKGIALPIVSVIAGAVLLAANNFMPGAESSNVKSVLVIFGAAAILCGVIIFLLRLVGGSGVPCLRKTGKALKVKELSFERSQLGAVLDNIERGDTEALLKMAESSVAAVVVILYRSSDGSFAACQPFEYAELEYRPLRDVKVIVN